MSDQKKPNLTNRAAGMPPGPMHWRTTVHQHKEQDDVVHLTFKLPFKPPSRLSDGVDIAFKTPDGTAFLAEHNIEPDEIL